MTIDWITRREWLVANSTEILLKQDVSRTGAVVLFELVPAADFFITANNADLFLLIRNDSFVDAVTIEAEVAGQIDTTKEEWKEATPIPVQTACYTLGPYPILNYGPDAHFRITAGDLTQIYIAILRLKRTL